MTAEERLRRLQRTKKAEAEGKHKGRVIDADLHAWIKLCLEGGMLIRNAATVYQCPKASVQKRVQALLVLEREL